MEKKLYRSRTDKKLCGICGGLGKYLGVDPTILRIIMVLIGLSGAGLLAYLVCALIIPEEPLEIVDENP